MTLIGGFTDELNNYSNVSSLYKSTIISKNNFNQILGEDGYIKIFDESGKEIGQIDSNTEEKDGNYEYIYNEPLEKVNIKTSDVKENGLLIIKNKKQFNNEKMYSKTEIETFKTFKTWNTYYITDTYSNRYLYQKNTEIPMIDSKTTATLSVNNNTITTNEVNEGIEFKIELNNNNENSDLWKNPFFLIELPEEIQEVSINSCSIVYGNNLEISKTEIIDFNGKKAIKVNITGTQEDFISNTMVGGSTIIINTNIKLKELTPTKQDNEIKLYYFNENKTNYDNEEIIKLDDEYTVGTSSILMNYITKVGFKTIQTITNFDDNNTVISSSNGQTEGKIEILSGEKTIKNNIIIMNNTGNETTNIKVLGRVPFAGNKNIVTGEDLGSTINTYLQGEVKILDTENVQYAVYYTTNGEADTDLDNTENGWTTDINSLVNIKSFMIIVQNLNQGEKLAFEYTTLLPAMLEHEEYAYGDLVSFYENNTSSGNVSGYTQINKIGITTGIGARANISLSAGIDNGAKLTEGQKLKYKITVKNTRRNRCTKCDCKKSYTRWYKLY